jgi:hypothetical protein
VNDGRLRVKAQALGTRSSRRGNQAFEKAATTAPFLNIGIDKGAQLVAA